MRKFSTFRFLLYLSVFDLLVLIICAPDAFLRFNYQIEIRNYSQFICRMHSFLAYFLTHVSSTILMLVSIDRALVVSSKSLFFNILRFKRFANIKKKEAKSLSCGLSICCIVNYGVKSAINKNAKNKSFINRNDLTMLFLLLFLTLLNCHYIFLMDINVYSDLNALIGTDDSDLLFLKMSNELTGFNLFDLIELKHCYPHEGKSLQF